jgi:hypothetical protein
MAEIVKSYIGVGRVLVRPYGSTGKRRHIGNVSELTVTHQVDVQRQGDYTRSGGGTAIRFERVTQIDVAMRALTFSAENWALATAGSTASVAAGTATGEIVKGYKGATVQLAHPPLAITSVTNVGATITYDAGDDYQLSPSGLSFPDGSAVVDAADLVVAYTYSQYAKVEGALGTASALDVLYEGLNEADSDRPVIINMWQMSVPSAEQIALIGTSLGEFNFAAELIKDPAKGLGVSAYYRALLVGVPLQT